MHDTRKVWESERIISRRVSQHFWLKRAVWAGIIIGGALCTLGVGLLLSAAFHAVAGVQ